jgi:hypothetical protein
MSLIKHIIPGCIATYNVVSNANSAAALLSEWKMTEAREILVDKSKNG